MTLLVLGIAAYYATHLIREFPFVRNWVELQHKPWSCNVCMSFWTSAFLFFFSLQPWRTWFMLPAAAGVCYMLLRIDEHTAPRIGKLPGE